MKSCKAAFVPGGQSFFVCKFPIISYWPTISGFFCTYDRDHMYLFIVQFWQFQVNSNGIKWQVDRGIERLDRSIYLELTLSRECLTLGSYNLV